MQLDFYKYQGTGNDFILLDNRHQTIQLSQTEIAMLCHRRFGIGADGLMLLNVSEGYDFEMKYYNADGAEGSMCGNGGRCLTQFAQDMGIQLTNYSFIASDGPHEAIIEKTGWVKLKMRDVHQIQSTDGAFILNTGSPHYVKAVNDLANFNVYQAGHAIRYNDVYKQNGINVNFVEWQTNGQLIVRTYERGVEDETYSCGTGVTAAAISMHNVELGLHHVSIITKGGALAVEYEKVSSNQFQNIWLCGPATFVFKGSIII